MSKNMNKDMDGKALGKAKAAGRVVTVAAATIAMTGGSMLSPLVAVAQDADGVGATGATAAVMSPLTSTAAAGTGAGAVSAAQKVADLQAAVDAERAKAATAKADLEAAAAPYDAAAVNQRQARGAYDAARGASDSAASAASAELEKQLGAAQDKADQDVKAFEDAQAALDAAKKELADKDEALTAA